MRSMYWPVCSSPSMRSTGLPSLNSTHVGSALISYCEARAGYVSVLIFTTFTFPLSESALTASVKRPSLDARSRASSSCPAP